MPKPSKKGGKASKKGQKKKKPNKPSDTNSPSGDSQSSTSLSTSSSVSSNEQLDLLFARLSTSPNRSKSIIADLLRAGEIGARDVSRLEDELNNAYSLVHEKGVPFSGLRLVHADDEDGRRIVKVDMTEDAIRFLCQNGDDGEEPSTAVVTTQQNGHHHHQHHTPTARSIDGLPILTLITSQTNQPSPFSDITDEAERRKKSLSEKEKGNELYQRRKFMEAAQHYSSAIELYPNDMVFYLNRAAAFYELSMYYKAVVDCWQAVELGNQDPTTTPKLLSKAWFRMGQARFKLQYLTECIEAYRKSISLNPSSESNQLALSAIAKAELLAQSPPDFKSLQTTPESQRRTFVPPSPSSLKAQVCVHCKEHLGEDRTPCPCCGLLLYCGQEHQRLDWPSHRSLCADLRMYVDDEFGEHGPVLIALSDQYRKMKLTEWEEYFRTRCVRVGGCSDRSRRMLTDSVTYPLTIVYSLQTLKIPAPKGRPLFIFVLGATENEEQLEPGHWGELSLFDPHIHYCVYLVGPELSEAKHKQSLKVSDKIILWYWKDHYHNFRAHQFKHGSGIARSGTIDPDLFILCNSGVGRLAAEWMPSLAPIMHSSTPTIFTTFADDELRRDVKLLKTMNAKITLEPAINPFASQRTRLNPVTLNIMRRSNMYLFGAKGFDGDVPKDISNVGTNEFVQQWDTMLNRKRDIIVHLPMSLVGPFIKAPKTGLPSLWKEFEKDPLWFVKFADFNRSLFEAKLQKAQTACITSSIDGLEKSFFVPISMWETPCYRCGDKGMLCCSKCNLLWYCTVDCRRKLNPFHKHICEHVKLLTSEQSDLLVLEDVSHNSDVLNLLRDKVPKQYYEHVANANKQYYEHVVATQQQQTTLLPPPPPTPPHPHKL